MLMVKPHPPLQIGGDDNDAIVDIDPALLIGDEGKAKDADVNIDPPLQIGVKVKSKDPMLLVKVLDRKAASAKSMTSNMAANPALQIGR
jgi:hypothetical protein